MSLLDEVAAKIGALPPEARRDLDKSVEALKTKMRFVPLPGPQTDAYLSKADVLLYGGQAGGGKALSLSTAIPTPHGWTTMGEVAVGDLVFDETGLPCKVVAKSEIETEDTFCVTFSDGTEVIAGARHQWITISNAERFRARASSDEHRAKRRAARPPRGLGKRPDLALRNSQQAKALDLPLDGIRTTRQIFETLRTAGGRINHCVNTSHPLHLPDAPLLIDPYVLGVWLGDGTAVNGQITGLDECVFERVAGYYPVTRHANPVSRGTIGLKADLRTLGVLGNKHIPPAYLRGSKDQRLALLQGLMDTDGHCDLRGQCAISLTNKRLIDGCRELLCSLGIKVQMREGKAKLNGRFISLKWTLKFLTNLPAFAMPRKLLRQKRGGFRGTHRVRYIVDVQPVAPEPVQCIQVDGARSTYLITEAFIPTHNSFLLMGLSSQEHTRSIIFRRESSQTDGLEEAGKAIIGNTARFNGTDLEWSWPEGRSLKLAGMQLAGDWMKHAGRERDMIGFDEAGEFVREQVSSLVAWNRGPEGQRCRIVLASNPPRSSDGYWMIEWFAPWLDIHFKNPAAPGELRWAILIDGSPMWVDGPDMVDVGGELQKPLSFTFIPAALADNPYRDTPEYRARLNSLPEPLRSQLLYGSFEAGGEDPLNQCIPTEWIVAAQQRWTSTPPVGIPLCAMGIDVAQGGCFDDQTEILTNEGWKLFDVLKGVEQVLTLDGDVAKWGEITQLHKYRHDGPMNLLDRACMSFCITDNHNLIAKAGRASREWKVRRYDDLPAEFMLKRGNTWDGASPASISFISSVEMPHGGVRLKEWTFDFVSWARLLGWFVSEGCVFQEARVAGRWRVNISQNAGPKLERISSLLDEMGIKAYRPSSRSGLEFSIAPIGEHLAKHCGVHAANKQVPDYIKNGSVEVMEAFLEEFRLGDGSVNGGGTSQYHSSSRLLIDDLQEILAKLGRAGKVRRAAVAGSEFKIGNRLVVRKRDVFTLTERQHSIDSYVKKENVKVIEYHGDVFCVSTPLRAICVRRKGTVMWSGNSDQTVIAKRHDGWFHPLEAIPGIETPSGQEVAGKVLAKRYDGAQVIVDLGGGWGGDALMHLTRNGVNASGYMGVKQSMKRTRDNQLRLFNERTVAYWRLREALDPHQQGGSCIMLPPDRELLADLAAPTFDTKSDKRGMVIQLEPKDALVKRLGRSPDKGDAVVMCWWAGPKMATDFANWRVGANSGGTPKVVMGRQAQRR